MTSELIDTSDVRYPTSILMALSRRSPLSAIGNVTILDRPSVAICGSRHASDSALHYAEVFGGIAASEGFVVVSGYAKGVDRAAHKGALAAGGSTAAVLAEGIESFRTVRELKGLIDLDRFVAVSPFEATAIWTVYRAMQRNKYLVGLSSGLFVVEARAKGGTVEAGRECLKQGKPLWVIDFINGGSERAGNELLMSLGGRAVRTMRELRDCLKHLGEAPRTTQSRFV